MANTFREKEERTTENKMERRVSTRFEKYWTESVLGDGQGDVEKKDHQSYRRPYMMGKARGKEEEDSVGTFDVAIIHCHANIWHADHSLPWRCLPCRSLTTVGSFNTVDIIHHHVDYSLMLGSITSVGIIYCHENHFHCRSFSFTAMLICHNHADHS